MSNALIQSPIENTITDFFNVADIELAKHKGTIVYLWLKGGSMASLQLSIKIWDDFKGACEMADWLSWEINDAIALGSQSMLDSAITQSACTWGHEV